VPPPDGAEALGWAGGGDCATTLLGNTIETTRNPILTNLMMTAISADR
jgi:hypothetical protein